MLSIKVQKNLSIFLRVSAEALIAFSIALCGALSYNHYFDKDNTTIEINYIPFTVIFCIAFGIIYLIFHKLIKEPDFKIPKWVFVLLSFIAFIAIYYSMEVILSATLYYLIVKDGHKWAEFILINPILPYSLLFALNYFGALTSKKIYIISWTMIVLPISLLYSTLLWSH